MTTPFARRLHAARPGGLERPARVVQPDVDAGDEVAGNPDVVVLEDEHATAEPVRAGPLEDLLDHLLAGPIGRVGLAGEDDLDRPSLVVRQQPGEALDVAEQQARPACRSRTVGRSRSSGCRDRARLRAHRGQPAPRRGGRTGSGAAVGRRSRARASGAGGSPTDSSSEIWSSRSQNRPRAPSASRLSRSARRLPASVSPIACPIQLGMWTPFVTPMISPRSRSPRHVASAVRRVELADGVCPSREAQRERRHVELARRPPSTPDARARAPCRSGRRPSTAARRRRGAGPATRRTRSAANRSLPAGYRRMDREDAVGPDPSQASVERIARRRRTREPARRAGTRSGPRSDARRTARSQAPGAPARRRRPGPAPGGAASRDPGRRGCG